MLISGCSSITGFINAPNPIKLADLKSKVILIHFWTYTCVNCIHTIPYLNDWYQTFGSSLQNAKMHLTEAIMDLKSSNTKGAAMEKNQTAQSIKLHEQELKLMMIKSKI
jgi:thiol-disulfide isomerase/thioredoxin